MKAKARRVARDSWDYRLGMVIRYTPEEGLVLADEVLLEEQMRSAERWADHLAMCSRSCCGNPRTWFGYLTMAEERFLLDAREQEGDVDVA
jgi:hypothetical protein